MTTTIEARDRLKRENAESLIVMRVGDFYELFREDAETASKLLGLTLCRMAKRGAGSEVAMCGFPYHQLEGYIARFVQTGHRVAICEQVK